MIRRCETCVFWVRYHGSKEKGQCRRRSPEVVAKGDGFIALFFGGFYTTLETKWPETNIDHWCGEYQEPAKDKETQ